MYARMRELDAVGEREGAFPVTRMGPDRRVSCALGQQRQQPSKAGHVEGVFWASLRVLRGATISARLPQQARPKLF